MIFFKPQAKKNVKMSKHNLRSSGSNELNHTAILVVIYLLVSNNYLNSKMKIVDMEKKWNVDKGGKYLKT